MFGWKMNPKIDSPWSWFVTLSCFLMNAVTFGLSCSFGIFYVALLQDFPGQESQTAWVVSLDYSMSMVVSPLTIYLCRRLTPRAVCCGGVLLTATSFYLASKAESLAGLYLTFGVMFGISTSLSHLSTIIVVRTNFKKHLGVAMAIGIGGVGVGGVVFSLLLPGLIETRGWRGALHYLSYITLSFTVCGLVLFPSEQKPSLQPQAESKPDKKPDEQPASPLKRKTGLKKLALAIPSTWRNKAFLVLNTALVLLYFVVSVIYCHIVNFAVQQGLSLLEGSKMTLFMTVGSTIGRLSIGPITKIPGMNLVLLGQAIILGICLTVTLFPLASSVPWLMILTSLFGFFDGNVSAMVPLIVDDVFTDKNQAMLGLGHLYALYFFPYLFGSPLAGLMYSMTGSYHTVFFSCGALLFVASCLMSLVYFLLPQRQTIAVVDQSEDVVFLSLTDRLPAVRNPDSNNNRLFNLKMCSLLDLSAEIFSEPTDGIGNHGSSCANVLLVPRVHPEKFPAKQYYYTDLDDQISGLVTQGGTKMEPLLNTTEKKLPDFDGIEQRELFDVFTELVDERNTAKDCKKSAQRDRPSAHACCDVSNDDAGCTWSNETAKSADGDDGKLFSLFSFQNHTDSVHDFCRGKASR